MKTILIVDDSRTILASVQDMLSPNYSVLAAKSASMAYRFLEKKTVDLILLDLWMPGEDGRVIIEKLKEHPQWCEIPVVFLTAEVNPIFEKECFELGASDFVTKPIVCEVLKVRIQRILENEDFQKHLEQKVREKQREVEIMAFQAIRTIANTIDAKDAYTNGHSERVAAYVRDLAECMGFDRTQCEDFHQIALLHDVGKIAIPEAILNKPAPLDDAEYTVMKAHTIKGGEILKDIKSLPDIEKGALYHHEFYDGSGYPYGLAGDDIPYVARMIALADSYDAMVTDRCYRKGMSQSLACEKILEGLGSQYDPEIGRCFCQMIAKEPLDSEELGDGSESNG
ncbi:MULTISPECIES: HD-GYP domain-containing protein [Eubacterium]|uniref:Stage 0 sporulation protein A homolog n=1 Tax=Eubacterium barkeri TaxID=1528 RepID=A0A1H3HYC7_EUBBA|nr:HD domain-containing phosphohydrolase [Eubacterium barkeri]SDY20486.1 putative two-component system response regulator [Eubacterium barkeri]